MIRLAPPLEKKLVAFAQALVDQTRARVIVPPHRPGPGFWFGGGNLAATAGGDLVLVGRYRNRGDSRSGLSAGERGCELAIFRSSDAGRGWSQIASFSKSDLDQPGRPVISIEGSALSLGNNAVELFVSAERQGIGYPADLQSFLKPGCGVWTIERMVAPRVESLGNVPIETVFQSADPEHLHVKDPCLYREGSDKLRLMFCSHPYCWTSSNTAFAERTGDAAPFSPPQYGLFPRGTTWDVAMARGTSLLDVPRVGAFRDEQVTLLFYDGGECVRDLKPHPSAVRRPRGYSCEELGGLAYFRNGDHSQIFRLSTTGPLFVSPHGTGCSRYVDVLLFNQVFYVTWQQSQPDQSQPLVLNTVDLADAAARL